MPTDELSHILTGVLKHAIEVQDGVGRGETPEHAAIQHGVMDYLETDHQLSVMVKYGDDDAVTRKYGTDDDYVWGAGGNARWTRFRVEHTERLTLPEEELIDQTFLAIGAWKVGRTGDRTGVGRPETHYLWPKAHPITELMPRVKGEL